MSVDRDLEAIEFRSIYGSGPTPSELVYPPVDRVAELKAMGYRAYLQTPEWKEKRRIAIDAAEHRCNRCDYRGSSLHAHHLTYERLGNEHPDDLEVLCRMCHAREHEQVA